MRFLRVCEFVRGKHDKTFVSFGESSVSFIFRISRTNQYDPIKYMAK